MFYWPIDVGLRMIELEKISSKPGLKGNIILKNYGKNNCHQFVGLKEVWKLRETCLNGVNKQRRITIRRIQSCWKKESKITYSFKQVQKYEITQRESMKSIFKLQLWAYANRLDAVHRMVLDHGVLTFFNPRDVQPNNIPNFYVMQK